MLDISHLSPIGIGTRGIGCFATKDTSSDSTKQIDALAYMFSHGCNFCEVNMRYAEGYAIELVAKGLKESGISRKDVFICLAVYLKNYKTMQDAQYELEKTMELFDTDYIDTVQFPMSDFLLNKFNSITQWIDSLLADKTIRYTSLTNGNLELLEQYYDHYKEKLFSHEVAFNFEIRENERLGIIPFHTAHDIKTIVYQPLRRNRTALRKRDIIESLSSKYNKSPNQILLNRIIHKGYYPLTKSENITHIKEHLDALHFTMSEEDYNTLDSYHISYTSPPIDWDKTGNGYGIDQLSNIFDQEYDKQHSIPHS